MRAHNQQEEEVFETMPENVPAPRVPAPTPKASAEKALREGLDEGTGPSASDTINALKGREGRGDRLPAPRVEYESLGDPLGALHQFETPEQRLARLQAEVADLLQLAEGSSHGPAEDVLGGDPAEIAAELRALEQRLAGVARARGVGAEPGAGTAGQQQNPYALPGSLLGHLQRLSSGTQQPRPQGEGGRVTYELHYTPSTDVMADSSKLAALEGSLAEIERQLGVMDPSCPFADLHSAVAHLQRRVALLDAGTLEGISKRLNVVTVDIERMLARKAELEGATSNPDTDRKVEELYEFCQRWSSTSAALPALVARLRSLQNLHQQSASFGSRLAALERQQDELQTLLETTHAAVGDLTVGLQRNMTVMQENMQSLEAKLAKATH